MGWATATGTDLHVVIGEAVRAGLDWRNTSRSQRTLQQQYMLLLVVSVSVQVIVVVGRVACVPRQPGDETSTESTHTGLLEILLREIFGGLLVEQVLEMLEGQSKLQDSGVDVGSLGQLGREGGGGWHWRRPQRR